MSKMIRKPDPFDVALWGLAVAFGVGIIYYYQLRSMQDSVTIQQETMVVSQRAYVYAKHANIISGDSNALLHPPLVRPPNAPIQVDIAFSNSGQTWARNESGSINAYLSKDGLGIPSDFAYPVDNHSQPVLIPPQTESHLLAILSQADYEDLIAAKKQLFVYGDSIYQDVFDKWHKTEYCFQLAGIDYKPDGTINQYLFWQGPTHNCADEDCKK